VANDINTAVNKITPADNNTMSSDPDSDDGDGKGGKDITASEQAGKSLAGMFSTHSKEKATWSARVSKQTRLQRGRWQEKSAEMTYEERQEYFKVKHQQVHEKALMSTQPEHKAKMETKRKNRECSENSKVIECIIRKPAKLLQKEKKQVAQLLD
jgi:fructosamine-3-kinase